MKNNSYSALGGVFEYLNGDCGYEQWSQYFIEKLSDIPAGARGMDIGCGNGYFTRSLSRAGYFMTGIDLSPEMLSKATDLALKEGVRAEFLLGDIAKLKLKRDYDFAVAANDCFNYVPPQCLKRAFANVYAALKRHGRFIFDISTPQKLRGTVGNNLFADDSEEATCLWFNTLKEDRIESDITVFTRGSDGTYTRADESQTLYIHEPDSLDKILCDTGFSVIKEGHLGKDEGMRMNFICDKI